MALFKNIFSRNSSDLSKSPSFNDFSLHVGQEVEDDIKRQSIDSDNSSQIFESERKSSIDQLSPSSSVGSHNNNDVWQSVFNPGRNFNMKNKVGRSYYDVVDKEAKHPTTWDYIVKSDNMKRLDELGKLSSSDGYVKVEEIKSALGHSSEIEKIIDDSRDGSGQIKYQEFLKLMKQS